MDHARTGGTLLNQKLTPGLMAGEEGLNKFVHLVRSYFRLEDFSLRLISTPGTGS